MKHINTKYLRSLSPCKDRLDNWITQYDTFNGSLLDFLDLTSITHDDKCWVYFRSVDKKIAINVAADMAEAVLHVFESIYPNDMRPRLAIEAARVGDADAYAAAYAAYAAAYAAARAAYAAAAAAATAAAYAAYAAAYAAATAVAYAYSPALRTGHVGMPETAQLEIMKRYIS